jgi:hypothetical protein
MFMSVEMSLLIAISGLVIATLTFITNFNRNNKKDTEESVSERASMNARLLTKLDMILDDVKDIKKDNADMRKEINTLSGRVLVLEQQSKIPAYGSSFVDKVD